MKFLHPITYSLVINLVCLVITGLLAWQFASPLLFIVAILVSNHALERFREDPIEQEIDDIEAEYAGNGAGFTADISKR